MIAEAVAENDWFMTRENVWYKKIANREDHVEATQIGKFPIFKIPLDEPVMIHK